MKKTLLSLTFGFLLAVGVQAQTYVDEDFNASGSALPANWISDPSGLWKTGTPDVIVPNAKALLGASINATGHESVVGINGNSNANNAILATPAFSIPASVTKAYVTFDLAYMGVRYTNAPTLKETASLVYTTDSGSTWISIQTLNANSSSAPWKANAISLSSLAGKSNVQLGFKYENKDTVLVGMALDNVKIWIPPTNDIALISVSPLQGELEAYGKVNDAVTLSGVVQNKSISTITSYTVYYQDGNNTAVSTQQSTSIDPFATKTFDISYTIPNKGAHNLKVWVELSGDTISANDSAMAYVEGVGFRPTKRIMFEEATGAWCQWCTRGSHNMKKFAKDHPGVASQVAVHNNDAMMVASYDQIIRSVPGFTGFPGIAIDRRYTDDPGNIEALYQQHKNDFGFAEVTMQDPTFSGNQASVSLEIKPAVEIKGGKLALIITENEVTGTGTGWVQQNAYAGGGSGPMGGYENKPFYIYDEVYEFVGRSITPSAGGAASGLPATMNEGQTYNATLKVTLNSAWTKDNLSYIVALIGKDGSVLNTDHYLYTTGLNKEEIGLTNAIIYPNPVAENSAYLNVTAENTMDGTIKVMDITGRTVNTIANVKLNVGHNTIEVPTASLTNGIYMVSLQSEKGNLNLKLQVTK